MITIHVEWSGNGPRTVYERDGAVFGHSSISFPELTDLKPPRLVDGFMFPALFPAMAAGETLRVDGPVSGKALRNARELVEAWTRMQPERYKPIDIEVGALVDDPPAPLPDGEAIALFSGGLDASFTALRHTEGTPDRYKLKKAVLVDIGESPNFGRLRQRVLPLLESLGIEPIVATFERDVLDARSWPMTHGAELAAVLHCFSDSYRYGLIGSSKAYEALILPWGSSPATDHLLSGSDFQLVHDGSGFSRAEKAERVGQNALARETIQVCWQGPDQASNCGKCLKCVLTRLDFIASGHGDLPAFPGPFETDMLDGFKFHSPYAVAEFGSLLSYADGRGLTDPWVEKLRAKLVMEAARAEVKKPVHETPSKEARRRVAEHLERGRLIEAAEAKRPIVGQIARLLYRSSSYIARRFT